MTISGNTVTFDFRCSAAGMSDYQFLFTRQLDSEFATSEFVSAKRISTGVDDPLHGVAFLITGALSDLLGWTDGTYTASPAKIETALVQSEVDRVVNSVNIADKERSCPAWSSLSSSSSSTSCFYDEVTVIQEDYTGDVLFKAGYNADVGVDDNTNELIIGAKLGAGEGQTCDDILINEHGIIPSSSSVPCRFCGGLIQTLNGQGGDEIVGEVLGIGVVKVTVNSSSDQLDVTIRDDKVVCDDG